MVTRRDQGLQSLPNNLTPYAMRTVRALSHHATSENNSLKRQDSTWESSKSGSRTAGPRTNGWRRKRNRHTVAGSVRPHPLPATKSDHWVITRPAASVLGTAPLQRALAHRLPITAWQQVELQPSQSSDQIFHTHPYYYKSNQFMLYVCLAIISNFLNPARNWIWIRLGHYTVEWFGSGETFINVDFVIYSRLSLSLSPFPYLQDSHTELAMTERTATELGWLGTQTYTISTFPY